MDVRNSNQRATTKLSACLDKQLIYQPTWVGMVVLA